MSAGMQRNVLSLAVAGALAADAKQIDRSVLRRLTVDIRIEVETADDSVLGGVVLEALREFMESPHANGDAAGKFEAQSGADVSWRHMNRYFKNGVLVGVLGVGEDGRKIDTITRMVKAG